MVGVIKKLRKNWLTKRTLKASCFRSVFFWNPLICCFFTLFFGETDHFARVWLRSFLISSGVSIFCFSAVGMVAKVENAFAKWRNRPAPVHPISWYYSISGFFMPLGLWVSFQFTGFVLHLLGMRWHPPDLDDYRIGLLLGALICGLFFLVRTRNDAREADKATQLKVKHLENDRLKAQISALTAQMNPHLLFNALNTIASLVPNDPKQAEDTILRLAELYRGVLESSKHSTHSLSTEIEICRAYLAVEHARFGDRLGVSIEIEEGLNMNAVQVPVLTVQPLVENAVKHGISNVSRGGQVRLRVQQQEQTLQILCRRRQCGNRAIDA